MNIFYLKFGSVVSKLLSWIPSEIQLYAGKLLGILWFDVLRIRRRVAIENINRCFPQWDDKEKIKIARLSVINLGRCFIEFLRIPGVSEKDKSQFTIEGQQHLTNALAKGKGVFLLTAHIGNGDWATVGLALHGIKLYIISKKMAFQSFNEFWFAVRQKLGTEIILDRNSSLQILKTLKKNGIIAFMLDQFLGPPIGIKTKFFGHETGTPMGLALLTGRSHAAVVPTYTFRQPNGLTVVRFEPEIPFEASQSKDETVALMTQRYCDHIEKWVRQHPDQWMWVHRRWKKFIVR